MVFSLVEQEDSIEILRIKITIFATLTLKIANFLISGIEKNPRLQV